MPAFVLGGGSRTTNLLAQRLPIQCLTPASTARARIITPLKPIIALVVQDCTSSSRAGLEPAAERIADPGFDTGTGWTVGGTNSISGGVLHLSDNSAEVVANDNQATVLGDVWEVQFDVLQVGNRRPYITVGTSGINNSASYYYGAVQTSTGRKTITFTIDNSFGDTLGFHANVLDAGSTEGVIDNVSMRKLSPLALTQHHVLAVQAATSLSVTDSPTVLGFNVLMTPSPLVSSSLTSSPVLVPGWQLSVANTNSVSTTGESLGLELVPNPLLDNLNGFTYGGGLVIGAGDVTYGGAAGSYLDFAIPGTSTGKRFRVELAYTGNSADMRVAAGPIGNMGVDLFSFSGASPWIFTFTASAVAEIVRVFRYITTTGDFVQLSMSVREIVSEPVLLTSKALTTANAVSLSQAEGFGVGPELLANGQFTADVASWPVAGGVTTSWQSGALRAVATTDGRFYQAIALPVGTRYSLGVKVDAVSGGGSQIIFQAGEAPGNLGSDLYVNNYAPGTFDLPFTSTQANNGVGVYVTNGVTADFDYLTLRQQGTINLGSGYPLSPSAAVSLATADNITLSLPTTILVVQAATSLSATNNVTVAPKTALTVNAAVSLSTTSAIALSSNTVLSVNAAVSLSQAANVTLSPKTALVVAGATSLSTAGNVTVASRYALTAQSATSLSTAGNVTITPRTALAPAAATSLATTGSPTLTSLYQLTVSQVVSLSTADNLILGGIDLVVSPPISLTFTTSPTLAPTTVLSVEAAVSLSQVDEATLAPRTDLSVQAALSASTAMNVVIALSNALSLDQLVSLATVDEPTLAVNYALAVQPAVSAANTNSPDLVTHDTLTVQALLSSTILSSPVLSSTLPPPPPVSRQQAVGDGVARQAQVGAGSLVEKRREAANGSLVDDRQAVLDGQDRVVSVSGGGSRSQAI